MGKVEQLDKFGDVGEQLGVSNPVLTPDGLAETIPGYRRYEPMNGVAGVWMATDRVNIKEGEAARVVLIFSGISHSGKNAVWELIEDQYAGDFKRIVTMTDREMRPDEEDGVDYYFVNKGVIPRMLEQGEIIGAEQQSQGWYGIPKTEIDRVVAGDAGVLVLVAEIKAWAEIRREMASRGIPAVTVFMLPELSWQEYVDILMRNREKAKGRLKRSVNEIAWVPGLADHLVVNRFCREKSRVFLEQVARNVAYLTDRMLRPDMKMGIAPVSELLEC